MRSSGTCHTDPWVRNTVEWKRPFSAHVREDGETHPLYSLAQEVICFPGVTSVSEPTRITPVVDGPITDIECSIVIVIVIVIVIARGMDR